jgi:hypothetical protein
LGDARAHCVNVGKKHSKTAGAGDATTGVGDAADDKGMLRSERLMR